MIKKLADILSRGDVTTGAMKGDPIASFIPLNQLPLVRNEKLRTWLEI